MNEVIVKLVADIKALEETMKTLKPEFEAYITDLSVDLEIRWQVWEDAPESLKNTGGWCSSGDLKALPDNFVSYDGPCYAERYQTIHAADILRSFEEFFEYDGSGRGGNWLEENEIESAADAVVSLREEILKENLHSYKYDW